MYHSVILSCNLAPFPLPFGIILIQGRKRHQNGCYNKRHRTLDFNTQIKRYLFSVPCEPLTVANGSVSPVAGVMAGGGAIVTCDPGHRVTGDLRIGRGAYAKCDYDGKWKNPPKCDAGDFPHF